ncbi:MAG: tetratricopeptide repeat protein [Acidobacteriota bacterium]|nr:tetratricopeptide repeat protein [Acidobacteriota bacterium]
MASNQFITLSSFLSHRAPAVFRSSAEYGVVSSQRLDEALVIGDRIVAACLGRPEFTKIGDVPAALFEVAQFEESGKTDEAWKSAGRWVQHNAEHWLKAILWVVDSPVYEELQERSEEARRQRKNARFNLFEAYLRLDLLTKGEANAPDPDGIVDPVRRNYRIAQDCRNDGHDPGGLPDRKDIDLAITLFLGPLLKWHLVLRDVLAGLISRPLRLDDAPLQTLRTIAEVQRNHVDRFGGREYWLQMCSERVAKLRETGGYLVLTGPEGQGKSALMAKLADRFAAEGRLLGSDGPKVRRDAPWLPGVLLHFGKQSARVDEIVTLLVAQANSQLIRAVPESLASLSYASPVLIDPQPYGSSNDEALDRMFEDRHPSTDRSRAPRRDLGVPDPTGLHNRALRWALERLVEERGASLMILDALDEITRDGAQLGFLPEPVPKGSVVIATTRPNLGLDLWLKLNRSNVEVLSLDNLTRDETPLLTRVKDSPQGRGKQFNDEAHKRSNGWAYVLAAIGREVERANGSFDSVSLSGLADNLLERQISEWTRSDSGGLLHLSLVLLAVFEPCSPLSVDEIQGYLIQQSGTRLTRAETVELLRRVGPQVEGLSSGRVKLAQSIFAQHVRSPHLSPRDLDNALASIAKWLGNDSAVSSDTIAAFVTAPRVMGEAPMPSHVTQTIANALKSREAAKPLRDIGLGALKKQNGVEVGLAFLKLAADLNEPRALRELGARYIDGRSVSADPEAGIRYLSRSAEAGDVSATLILADRLLGGQGLPADTVNGERWLRRAAATGDARAMSLLGTRLLFGDRLLPDRPAGLSLLCDSAAKDESFTVILASVLFDGPIASRDSDRAVSLLRGAAKRGNGLAACQLAERLLDGNGVELDESEGRRILVDTAEAGDVRAMCILGSRLITGQGIAADGAAGESWLRRAIDEGSGLASVIFAHHCLPGGHLAPNESQAIEILRKASDHGHQRAKRDLGRRFLEGNGLAKNRSEGIRLLEELIADGDVVAMTVLGEWLSHQPSEEDRDIGTQHLREAARLGGDSARRILIIHLLNHEETSSEGEAMLRSEAAAFNQHRLRELGERLVAGNGVADNPGEGEVLLRTGANQGFVEPMIALAKLIDFGEIPEARANEAIDWLRVAADLGDSEARILLAERLLDGESSEFRMEGHALLLDLASRGDSRAIVELADRLFDGRGIASDKIRAREQLERAVARGIPAAMRDLARRLLDGDGVAKASDEGLRLLSLLAERGDRNAKNELGRRLITGDGVPRDRDAGLHVLRSAAEAGNLGASTLLGKLLIAGKEISKDTATGEAMLRRAAEAGYGPAMRLLGALLIDGLEMAQDVDAGKGFLLRACRSGDTRAMVDLGTRLLAARPLTSEPGVGEFWLRKSARRGDHDAMVDLGTRLIEGDGVAANESEGKEWLRRASGNNPQKLSSLGVQLFERGQTNVAIDAFLRAFEQGSTDAGNNIAYMLRRGEIQQRELNLQPVAHYLEGGLKASEPFNRINLALCLAQGFQHEIDWLRADEVVESLGDSASRLVDWWHSLATRGDSEGDLVLGWLGRHGLIVDPEGLSFSDRLVRARSGGWVVPDWMFTELSAGPPS